MNHTFPIEHNIFCYINNEVYYLGQGPYHSVGIDKAIKAHLLLPHIFSHLFTSFAFLLRSLASHTVTPHLPPH